MSALPAYDPTTPFLAHMPAGLAVYRKITIRGRMTHDQFNINLQTGPSTNPRDDTALHISIRPRDAVIIRNSIQFRNWGIEERFGGCPVQKKSFFDVTITVKPNSYGIAVNGAHYCDFNHRMPYASVRFVHLGEGAKEIPCLGAILGGLQPGKKIIVQGTITSDRLVICYMVRERCKQIRIEVNFVVVYLIRCHRFNINLQYGPEVDPRDDTALHLSIRPGDRRIVRNTYADQCWQDEERSGGCPINVGDPFTLEIRVKDTHYSIRFNDEKYCTFSHRMPCEMVNFIHLGAGASIDSVLETF
uniref:Galectin n=1 Tax=Anopheles christyi TaxID=43041 RepID=A0A182JZW7_9DIPT